MEIADLATSDNALAIVLVVNRLADRGLERGSKLSSTICDLARRVLGEFGGKPLLALLKHVCHLSGLRLEV